MKKRILPFLLAAVMLLLCGCSGTKNILENLAVTTTAVQTVKITFREGLCVPEYAQLLEENGICSAADFLAAVNAPEGDFSFVSEIPNPEQRPFLLEGYLFPDTYEFYLNMSAQKVLSKFLANYNSKITNAYRTRAAELGYSVDEILRIASIIQEEATDPEMKKVSSVLHNRLNSAYGKLECDVTVHYLTDFVAPYVDDVSVYSELYNAYKVVGLPAGPITNVGINAIEAALYPAQTDYYFFLTDEQGNFHYAATWDEHSSNVAAYVN